MYLQLATLVVPHIDIFFLIYLFQEHCSRMCVSYTVLSAEACRPKRLKKWGLEAPFFSSAMN